MPDMDVTALDAGREFGRSLRDRGELWIAGALLRPLDMLERAGYEARAYPNAEAAIAEFRSRR